MERCSSTKSIRYHARRKSCCDFCSEVSTGRSDRQSRCVADVRVISATNTDLNRLVEKKIFREDLHYRLNVLSLSVPPLRERGADILKLASHFLNVYAREQGRETPSFSELRCSSFLNTRGREMFANWKA